MLLVWFAAFAAGLATAAFASRRAVTAALTASEIAGVAPGLVGLTVLAVGTDLPEIANSIIAAVGDHGDLVVGDAAGSALTQVTLVLAILCLAAAPIAAERPTVLLVGSMTTVALVSVAVIVADGSIGRLEGLALVAAWIGALLIAARRASAPDAARDAGADRPQRGRALGHATRAIGWLAIVGVAATIVVESFLQLTDALAIPELLASAVVLSLGTSLPELVVDLTAARRGAVALAVGDLFGSSLLDSTLALGIGPAVRAIDVSETAVAACLIAAFGVMAATAIAASRPLHGRRSAIALLAVYAAATTGLLMIAA